MFIFATYVFRFDTCLRKIITFLRGTLLGIILCSILWNTGNKNQNPNQILGKYFIKIVFLYRYSFACFPATKGSKKPTAQLHRADDSSNSIEIEFNVPFEIGGKITEEELRISQIRTSAGEDARGRV
uniref:Motilin/ghrelin-associated peptide domain-containing protein n=1 Tax=Strigops habroptila TaxID=2489341 RepID=A0A672VFK0_STRHB